jgi:hypothetical protein
MSLRAHEAIEQSFGTTRYRQRLTENYVQLTAAR